MNLAAAQQAFIAEIAGDDDQPSTSLGMAIYRNAYRARLVAALEVSFERTRRWVGEEAFAAAAAHYVLITPPQSWTLDAYGADFPAQLATLFAEDPEVAELAWLEWHMQRAFAAPDIGELAPSDLVEAGFNDADWQRLRFSPAAGFAARAVTHQLAALWHGLADPSDMPERVIASPDQILIVWRRSMQPQFHLLDAPEWIALKGLIDGQSFGAATRHAPSAEQLGLWLAGWLQGGLFGGYRLAD